MGARRVPIDYVYICHGVVIAIPVYYTMTRVGKPAGRTVIVNGDDANIYTGSRYIALVSNMWSIERVHWSVHGDEAVHGVRRMPIDIIVLGWS